MHGKPLYKKDAVSGRAKSFTLGTLSGTRTFDGLGRIVSETSSAGGSSFAYTGYTYDGDGHCTSRNAPEGSWTYGYDSNGYLNSGSGVASLTYTFDEAGRPTTGPTGGSTSPTDYRPTVRQNADTVRVFGSVNPSATLTINGTSVTVNGTTGQYNAIYTPSGSTWQTYTVTGSLAATGTSASALATETRKVFVPPASEGLGYDGTDGNRTSDSRWSFTWDNLDRLTAITEANTPLGATPNEIDCVYDLQGRRVKKTVNVNGIVTKVTTTLWDKWRPVMEIDKDGGGDTLAQRYYTWGPDVSGDIDSEAGIGGLVEIMEKKGPAVTVSVPIYDGIGNVTGLVDEATGQQVASYTYGPFGEVLGATGPRAESCPFRFQTKLYDCETGYYYFGKRYFDPTTLTWLNRDPIREDGGVNLYAYCNDDPVGNYDAVGEADRNITLELMSSGGGSSPIDLRNYGWDGNLRDGRGMAAAYANYREDHGGLPESSRTRPLYISSWGLPPEVQAAMDDATPTGSGFSHEASLYSATFLNLILPLMHTFNHPDSLITGKQDPLFQTFHQAYTKSYGSVERSDANFNFNLVLILAPGGAERSLGVFFEDSTFVAERLTWNEFRSINAGRFTQSDLSAAWSQYKAGMAGNYLTREPTSLERFFFDNRNFDAIRASRGGAKGLTYEHMFIMQKSFDNSVPSIMRGLGNSNWNSGLLISRNLNSTLGNNLGLRWMFRLGMVGAPAGSGYWIGRYYFGPLIIEDK